MTSVFHSIRTSLKRLIEAVGFKVRTFGSAREFLKTYRQGCRGCLLLDIRLPNMTGLELQNVLASEGDFPSIVFLTGYGDVATSVMAMKGGAVDFLEKPFDAQDLLNAIHRAIAKDDRKAAEHKERTRVRARINSLTPREFQVFELVVAGHRNRQVASELGISEKTVKAHRGRVMRKMDPDSLADLVRMAEKAGLPHPPSPSY